MYHLNGSPAESRGPVNWGFVATIFAIISIAAVIASSGFQLGYTYGYANGHIAGYIARSYELPPRVPCAGISNCEAD
jgi:hypothetical protein